jgi:hypothetical protein
MAQRTRWNAWLTARSHTWEQDLREAYHPACTQVPLPRPTTHNRNIATLMTLDPSLGFSHRSPYSDGLIRSVNLTMQPQSFAPILAFIGAVRFLRAQRITGQLINYSLPEALHLTISPETARPMLAPVEQEPSHALVRQALACLVPNPLLNAQWQGLFFQTLQTQGAKPAISRFRGYLPFQRFTQITQRIGSDVLSFWNTCLQAPSPQARDECNLLTEFLLTHHPQAWLAHLRSRAITLCTQITSAESVHTYRLYSLHEVKEITMALETRSSTPLHTILERKEGTLHFGQALRLLSRARPSDAREVIEELDTLQTGEQLLFLLGRLVQQCSLAQAKSPFILIPSEPDFKQLLQDVDQYGARTIAGMLIVLSALRYPRTTPGIAEPEPVDEQHQDSPPLPHPTVHHRHLRESRMVEPLTLSSEHDTDQGV